MITFLFICFSFVLIFIINIFIRNSMDSNNDLENLSSFEKEDLLAKKTKPVLYIGLIAILIGIIYINKTKQNKSEENNIENSVLNETKNISEKDLFLQENDFKTDAEFTDSQFKEFKNLIESGVFKDESFCDVFQKSLDITNNSKNYKEDLKKLYSKYNHIPYFEDLVIMYGWKVCQPKKINSDKNNYVHSSDANPCIISEDFIKQDLYNPKTASFSSLNCKSEENANGTYTILRKVSAKNSLGVEREYIYKLTIGFKGGIWVDMNNWDLISIQSEEYIN